MPCLTLRENTERPVTVSEGTNTLLGTNINLLLSKVDKILTSKKTAADAQKPELWDGIGIRTDFKQAQWSFKLLKHSSLSGESAHPIVGRKIKIAIVGCGRIFLKHLEAVKENYADLELVAVCDTDLKRLESAKALTGCAGFDR